jgi:Flp pilus assembly protein TadD
VSIEDASTHARTAQTDVRIDGSFEFHGISTGEYTLCVADGSGHAVWQQSVTIQGLIPEVDVRLPDRERIGTGGKAATVSLKELMHPPAKKAVQAFHSALRLSSTGKHGDAVTQLETAVRISPEFAAAHTNLAVEHFRLGRMEESAAESARAIEIGGPDPLNLCNLAMAQALLQRYDEAAKSARASLRLDSHYVRANMILGFILVDEPATRAEGIQHLEKAAADFDLARRFLERLQTPK